MDIASTMTDPRSRSIVSVRKAFEAPRKPTIIRVRWLVVIIFCYLVLFSNAILLSSNFLQGFSVVYLLTNAALYFIADRHFDSSRFISPLVVLDTLCLTFALVVTGELGSDFYLTYFLIILIASFWQDFRWTMGFAVLITLLYGFLLYVAEALGPSHFLRLPFLFISSLFYGYFTQLAQSGQTLLEQAEAAGKDHLTGLANRRLFDERIKEEFERARRYGRDLTFLMLDVDNFKKVNDTFGHQSGDEVLKTIAKHLADEIRSSDFVARHGGEEFAIILAETNSRGGFRVADRIRLQIERINFQVPNGNLSVTVSIGMSSTSEKKYDDHSQIVQDADQALYLAKSGGRNRIGVLR